MQFKSRLVPSLTGRLFKPHRYRAVGRSENPGVPVLFGGYNLVEIGLTDLPKSGFAMAPRAPARNSTPEVYIFIEDTLSLDECFSYVNIMFYFIARYCL